MKIIPYQKLIQTAIEFKCFTKRNLNIDSSNSWIEKSIGYVRELSNTLANNETKTKYLKINNQNSECLWALMQLMDLAIVYSALVKLKKLNKLNEKLLKSKVKKIIKDPFLPTKETKETNEPRNILFELILLGKLLNYNFDATVPSETNHPDIKVSINENIYAIACKRIFSLKTFVKNFYRAKHQLEKYSLNRREYNFGVIAINVTRVFNPGDKLLIDQNEEEAKNNAFNELERLFNQFKDKLTKNSNKKIPALFLFLSTPVVILKNQRPFLAGGTFLTICELPNPKSLFRTTIKSDFGNLLGPETSKILL